jgi:Bacitracin resistance protein BacA
LYDHPAVCRSDPDGGSGNEMQPSARAPGDFRDGGGLHAYKGNTMNDLLSAALLGIIEGLTEFLPVSSTGHLLVAEQWLGGRSELFNVGIQAGAILAAVVVFWPRLMQLAFGLGLKENRDYLAKPRPATRLYSR